MRVTAQNVVWAKSRPKLPTRGQRRGRFCPRVKAQRAVAHPTPLASSQAFRVALQDLVAVAGPVSVGIGDEISRDLDLVALGLVRIRVFEANGFSDQRPRAGRDFVAGHRFGSAVGRVILDQRLAVLFPGDRLAAELVPGGNADEFLRGSRIGGRSARRGGRLCNFREALICRARGTYNEKQEGTRDRAKTLYA